jgi:hypothetical protein
VAGFGVVVAAGFAAGLAFFLTGAGGGQTTGGGGGTGGGIAANFACRSLARFSAATASICSRSPRARRPSSSRSSAWSSAELWSPGAAILPAVVTRSSTSYSASTLRYAASAFAAESGAASAAASSGGSVVTTSRRIDATFVSASPRTADDAFHLSVRTSLIAVFTTSSEGCSTAEGSPPAAAGPLTCPPPALCPNTTLDPHKASSTTKIRKTIEPSCRS